MKLAVLAVLSAALTTSAFGWGDLGHSAIGYIAESNLTPEGKKFMNSIMGGEPMPLSAIWPDHVRDDRRYDAFANYHFFEIPPGMTYGNIPADRTAPQSADTIIEQGPTYLLLKNNKDTLNVHQKSIMMRYYIHVVGDVHQPLHVGNGLDRGANLCDVMLPDPSGKLYKTNLHSAWDTGLVDHLRKKITVAAEQAKKPIKYFSYKHLADAIIEEAKVNGTYDALAELATKSARHQKHWYSESQTLHADVYPDATPTAPQDRQYCKIVNLETGKVENGKYDPSKVPELSSEYVNKSLEIIKKRIIMGGLRLATEINAMAKLRGDKPWTAEKEAEFFRKVLPETKPVRNPSSVKKSKVVFEHADWCHDSH